MCRVEAERREEEDGVSAQGEALWNEGMEKVLSRTDSWSPRQPLLLLFKQTIFFIFGCAGSSLLCFLSLIAARGGHSLAVV